MLILAGNTGMSWALNSVGPPFQRWIGLPIAVLGLLGMGCNSRPALQPPHPYAALATTTLRAIPWEELCGQGIPQCDLVYADSQVYAIRGMAIGRRPEAHLFRLRHGDLPTDLAGVRAFAFGDTTRIRACDSSCVYVTLGISDRDSTGRVYVAIESHNAQYPWGVMLVALAEANEGEWKLTPFEKVVP